MKYSVIELAKNGNVVVDAINAQDVVDLAKRVGVCAHWGASILREDGTMGQVLYTDHPAPAWVALAEELMRNKWVEAAPAMVEEFTRVCRVLGVCVHGGATVERDGVVLQGFYIE